MKNAIYETIVKVGGQLTKIQCTAPSSYAALKMMEAQYGAANVKSGAVKIG
jgi:hypothetical protein